MIGLQPFEVSAIKFNNASVVALKFCEIVFPSLEKGQIVVLAAKEEICFNYPSQKSRIFY
jgi:hypothetical protein